jgi:hypothetical protein
MNKMYGGNGSNDDDNPKKAGGYKSPPLHGRIKPGEVRNPHGRNGRQVPEEDAFEKVRRLKGRVNFDGKTTNVMSDHAYWLKVMSMAHAGNMGAARIIAKELADRRKLGPPPLTAEELAQEAAELVERERLSATIVDALERMAAEKRRGDGPPVRVRYGLDGRPIAESPVESPPSDPTKSDPD